MQKYSLQSLVNTSLVRWVSILYLVPVMTKSFVYNFLASTTIVFGVPNRTKKCPLWYLLWCDLFQPTGWSYPKSCHIIQACRNIAIYIPIWDVPWYTKVWEYHIKFSIRLNGMKQIMCLVRSQIDQLKKITDSYELRHLIIHHCTPKLCLYPF